MFSIYTHDVYYSKDSNFDGMSENQMKIIAESLIENINKNNNAYLIVDIIYGV